MRTRLAIAVVFLLVSFATPAVSQVWPPPPNMRGVTAEYYGRQAYAPVDRMLGYAEQYGDAYGGNYGPPAVSGWRRAAIGAQIGAAGAAGIAYGVTGDGRIAAMAGGAGALAGAVVGGLVRRGGDYYVQMPGGLWRKVSKKEASQIAAGAEQRRQAQAGEERELRMAQERNAQQAAQSRDEGRDQGRDEANRPLAGPSYVDRATARGALWTLKNSTRFYVEVYDGEKYLGRLGAGRQWRVPAPNEFYQGFALIPNNGGSLTEGIPCRQGTDGGWNFEEPRFAGQGGTK